MSSLAGASMRAVGVLLGSSILAQYPLPAFAQSKLKEETETVKAPRSGDAVYLDTVKIGSNGLGFGAKGDAVYTTDAPVSATTGEDIQTRFGGDVQAALRATPGTFSRQNPNQPGIEVNIRGMSGYGRVNGMIDGVPQTFKNVSSHEASGGSLLYLHPELIGGLQVVRGAVPGAAGAGTLTGAANFTTLTIDDVVREGQDRGVLTRLKFGDNGYNKSGMLAYGQRFGGLWGGEGEINITAAVAYTGQGNYRDGNGKTTVNPAAGLNASANSPRGGLVKIEVKPNSVHSFHLGTRWYDNTFLNSSYHWAVDNKTTTAGWSYRPDSDWVNLDLELWHNDTELEYLPGSGGGYVGRRTEDVTYGASLTNHAQQNWGTVGMDLTYGLSWGRNDFKTHERRGGNHPGTLDKTSLYAEAAFDLGRFSVTNGLRYDHFRLNGWRAPYPAGQGDCPAGGPACGNDWATTDGGKLLPKLGVSYKVNDSLDLYATYAETFRPPSSHEVFFAMVPFTTGVGSGVANNLDLKPETSKGIDIGLNWREQSLLRDGDKLGLKLGYFRNRISNFIVNDFVNVPGRGSTAMWVNRPGKTTMQGVELEANYDAGFAFANLALTVSDTDDQPFGQGAGAGNGEGAAQPDAVATLDLGTRLMDEKLKLGAQIRYVGKSRNIGYDWSVGTNGWVEADAYTLVDLYGSYAVNDQVEAFVSVENVADKAYGYAGSGVSGATAQAGRGRTFILGVTTRF